METMMPGEVCTAGCSWQLEMVGVTHKRCSTLATRVTAIGVGAINLLAGEMTTASPATPDLALLAADT